MSELCKWLHNRLEQLPLVKFPFNLRHLPRNGIYFFYEEKEIWGHNGNTQRIVRIGTHREGNFRSRIKEHYLIDESKMDFESLNPKPSDRSVFRKNIGRALLNKHEDSYLQIWEIDFTTKKNRKHFGHIRDIKKERRIESAITSIIRDKFFFKFIIIEGQTERMGSKGLESSLIGTLAHCKACRLSNNWLGNHSPLLKIRESGLWQTQHLKASVIKENDKMVLIDAIDKTKEWMKKNSFK